MVCIAMILQLRLGRNLRKIKMVSVSLVHSPIMLQSLRMAIGYSFQDGTAFKTQIPFGASSYPNLEII